MTSADTSASARLYWLPTVRGIVFRVGSVLRANAVAGVIEVRP